VTLVHDDDEVDAFYERWETPARSSDYLDGGPVFIINDLNAKVGARKAGRK